MSRNITECQQRLIALGYPVGPYGADGRFGVDSLAAYNRFLASKGRPPVEGVSMAQLNRDLFPEEQPAHKPPASNPLKDWLIGLAIKQAVDKLKDSNMNILLTGAKTYIIAGLLLACSAVETIGFDIPGFEMNLQTAFPIVLGLIFARNGAKTEAAKVASK